MSKSKARSRSIGPFLQLTLSEVASRLNGRLGGKLPANVDELSVDHLAPLEQAGPSALTFFANRRFLDQFTCTAATAVLVAPRFEKDCPVAAVVVPDPYYAYAVATHWFAKPIFEVDAGIHDNACIHPTAQVSEEACIGANVVIGSDVQIAAGAVIGSNTVIGPHSKVGAGTVINANVTLCADVHIGQYCCIQSGAVIGADGFGFAPLKAAKAPAQSVCTTQWKKIAQLGGVRIGDSVEIGANTCIDRGALGNTVIEDHVIIDNQVQIAHNCFIGAGTAMAGCVGIAGSTKIGKNCTIAGKAGIAGHLTIVDGTHIGMSAQVTNSITQAGAYGSGTGLLPHKKWLKLVAKLRRFNK